MYANIGQLLDVMAKSASAMCLEQFWKWKTKKQKRITNITSLI